MERHLSQKLGPRVLIVMPDQWPRALLRAELIEAGYDTVGARTFEEAGRLLDASRERGPLSLVVLDQSALKDSETASALRELGERAIRVLLARSGAPRPAGPWERVLQRPLSIGDIVAEVRALLPVPRQGAAGTE